MPKRTCLALRTERDCSSSIEFPPLTRACAPRRAARSSGPLDRHVRATLESVTCAAPTLLTKLRDALSKGPPLRLAVLFGSQATGSARPGSDFDIAILPLDLELSLGDELALATSLSAVTGSEVDLVRLDKDDPLLHREIALHGICLLEEAPGTFSSYRANAVSRWIDFEETIAPHRARFLRRLAGSRP